MCLRRDRMEHWKEYLRPQFGTCTLFRSHRAKETNNNIHRLLLLYYSFIFSLSLSLFWPLQLLTTAAAVAAATAAVFTAFAFCCRSRLLLFFSCCWLHVSLRFHFFSIIIFYWLLFCCCTVLSHSSHRSIRAVIVLVPHFVTVSSRSMNWNIIFMKKKIASSYYYYYYVDNNIITEACSGTVKIHQKHVHVCVFAWICVRKTCITSQCPCPYGEQLYVLPYIASANFYRHIYIYIGYWPID